MDKSKLPGLRVALTAECNLNCEYCSPGGECYLASNSQLKKEELLKILKVASDIGISYIVFSGGEPLLEKNKLIEVTRELLGHNPSLNLRLSTNGVRLKQNLGELKKIKFRKAIISLDSINRQKFNKITGHDLLEKVLEGIDSVQKVFPLRINVVLTKKNYSGIWDLIDYCITKKIDLKILDLNYFRIPGKEYWTQNYQSTQDLIKKLRSLSTSENVVYGPGGYGIPMIEFKVDGIKIRVKDSTKGTTYSSACENCELYPEKSHKHYCQEGLYEMFLSSGGKLRTCKHRSDLCVNFSKINLNNEDEIRAGFSKVLDYYKGVYFVSEEDLNQNVKTEVIKSDR